MQEIEAQRAATEMARAALAAAEWKLQQRTAAAPAAGRVVDTYYRTGEMVPAGAAVLSLLPDGALRVRFFVPEPQLASRPHRRSGARHLRRLLRRPSTRR